MGTDEQIADILTKPLLVAAFQKHRFEITKLVRASSQSGYCIPYLNFGSKIKQCEMCSVLCGYSVVNCPVADF